MPRTQLYKERLAAETHIYENCLDVHSLPPIFHYWSNAYVRPMLEQFGFSSPNDGFFQQLLQQCERSGGAPVRFLSIGSGNSDLEIELAVKLREQGFPNFTLECMDVNTCMLDRGRAAARVAGVEANLAFLEADFNSWEPAPGVSYDAVIANQSLHHVLRLEHLLDGIRASLKPGGTFILSELIGRNGHLRWPEATAVIQEFWQKLPPSYRFNSALDRYEERFEDWDCSAEGFEGVRSQDILPLLLERFHFRLFAGFANLIDPFVDRVFGRNFDAGADWDRQFIDAVHARDEHELAAGRIKPTHMFAVVGHPSDSATRYRGNLSPDFAVRWPDRLSVLESPPRAESPYSWGAWPHSPEREIEIAYSRLKRFASDAQRFRTWAISLKAEGEERETVRLANIRELEAAVQTNVQWALRLDAELQERTAWALALNSQREIQTELNRKLDEQIAWLRDDRAVLLQLIDERTAWARGVVAEMERARDRIHRLEEEFTARTAWAQRLDEELRLEKARRAQLESERDGYLNHPAKCVRLWAHAMARGTRRFLGIAPRA